MYHKKGGADSPSSGGFNSTQKEWERSLVRRMMAVHGELGSWGSRRQAWGSDGDSERLNSIQCYLIHTRG